MIKGIIQVRKELTHLNDAFIEWRMDGCHEECQGLFEGIPFVTIESVEKASPFVDNLVQ